MRYVLIALMTMLCLTACSMGRSRALPDIVNYNKDQRQQAHKELEENCRLGKILCEFMKDYKVMRDQTRKLKK